MREEDKVHLMWWLIFWSAILLFFCSCATDRIPVERVKIVERMRDSIRYDSVYIHDSTYIYDRGETIYQYKQNTEYRYLFVNKTDTVIKVDSIPYIVTVEKELSLWQQFKIDFGGLAMVALLLVFLIRIKK